MVDPSVGETVGSSVGAMAAQRVDSLDDLMVAKMATTKAGY